MLISLPRCVLFPYFLVKLVCPCVFIALVFHLLLCCTCMVASSSVLLMVLSFCPWSSLIFVLCVISLKTLLIDPHLHLVSPATLQLRDIREPMPFHYQNWRNAFFGQQLLNVCIGCTADGDGNLFWVCSSHKSITWTWNTLNIFYFWIN